VVEVPFSVTDREGRRGRSYTKALAKHAEGFCPPRKSKITAEREEEKALSWRPGGGEKKKKKD